MSKVAIQGNASGSGTLTIAAPNTNSDRTINLADEAGTLLVNGTNSNVGIGTTNPIADLSIVDSSTNTGIELQPEITTDTNRITNYDRVESAYKKFILDASEQRFRIAGFNKVSIESDGDLNVHAGDVIIETLGKGINFAGPTSQGGSVSQTLDAYEEGTWEPDLRGVSSNPTVTYHADTGGFYIKIGRMVYLTGTIRTTAISGGSGGVVVGNLPFTIASRSNGDNADGANACRIPIWNGSSSAVPTIVHMRTGTALLNIMSTRHDSVSFTLQVSDWGSTCMMAFSCVIYTA